MLKNGQNDKVTQKDKNDKKYFSKMTRIQPCLSFLTIICKITLKKPSKTVAKQVGNRPINQPTNQPTDRHGDLQSRAHATKNHSKLIGNKMESVIEEENDYLSFDLDAKVS